MTLAEWLKAEDMTDEAFAERVGISRSMITKLRHRTASPSFNTARRIHEATSRLVSFDELAPTVPTDEVVDLPTEPVP